MLNPQPDLIMEPGQRTSPPLLIVLSGPSGVGKDVIVARMKERGLPFHFAITATTRPKRDYEIDGVHYYFRTVTQFQEMLAQNELLEHATVYGNYYGPPKFGVREALARGEDVILRIDVQGAEYVRQTIEGAVLVFVAPGSYDELISRLMGRGTEDPDSLAIRLATYEKEMRAAANFDYMVINRQGQLDEAVDLIAAILQAEKAKVSPRQVKL
ncbi:MAG: guanylate kinase [Chloroflexi bacterium]|nr:guanylate kinase [Chloroflexota bacterium]